jgi:hypothetical protein
MIKKKKKEMDTNAIAGIMIYGAVIFRKGRKQHAKEDICNSNSILPADLFFILTGK